MTVTEAKGIVEETYARTLTYSRHIKCYRYGHACHNKQHYLNCKRSKANCLSPFYRGEMMREVYERIIKAYFKKHKRGTVYDIIAWMKTKRVKKARAEKPSSYDRGLLIPSVGQVSSLVRRVGARNLGTVKLRSRSEVILWGVDFQ